MSRRTDTPTEPPEIYDQVPAPDGHTCERWKPVSESFDSGMEPCENDAAVLFVYEASMNPSDDGRRNCLACENCAPLPAHPKPIPDGGVQGTARFSSQWLYTGLVVTMTFLAAAWGGLMADEVYFLAALVGTPVPLSWYVLFKERDLW